MRPFGHGMTWIAIQRLRVPTIAGGGASAYRQNAYFAEVQERKQAWEEQKAVKTTAFDLQINPASPGMNFHRLAKSRDKGFWSVRVNQDIRLIVHRTERSLLLCYVDHHDRAYAWAERRKLETHPATGAAQLVEIRERVQEVFVPVEWLADVRRAISLECGHPAQIQRFHPDRWFYPVPP